MIRCQGSGFRVQGSGFRIQGSGLGCEAIVLVAVDETRTDTDGRGRGSRTGLRCPDLLTHLSRPKVALRKVG